jgi:hypothetical protein
MEAASEKGEASESAEVPLQEPTLDELLSSLNLKEKDTTGVFIPKEEVEAEGGDKVDGGDAPPSFEAF